MLPSGQQTIFDNRVGWARTYLKKAGVLETTRRGYYRITERGERILRQNSSEINTAFLRQFPEFAEFQRTTRIRSDEAKDERSNETQTPEEAIETAYQKLRQDLATDILQMIKGRSPAFFERLVIDLLVKMGMAARARMPARRLAGAETAALTALSRRTT